MVSATADDSGIPADGLTNDTTPTLSGTAEPGSSVEVFRDGVSIGTVTADAGGAWSLADSQTLADGAYVYTAIATDAAGNTSPASAGFTVTVDTAADPASDLAVTIDDGDGLINAAEAGALAFTLTGIDPDATATVTFSDGVNTVVVTGLGNGSDTVDLSSLADGPITASVSVTDTAGNTAAGTSDTASKGVATTFTGTIAGDIADAATGTLIGFTGATVADLQDAVGDVFNGNNGNDTIMAGSGDDVVDGNEGSDIVAGGVGNDTLNGGSGSGHRLVCRCARRRNGGSAHDCCPGNRWRRN